jgi:pimeloyl-ACP methyl ester carboxylesterase
VSALEKPPYVDPAAIQRRLRLLADRGTIERGKTFNALLREALFSMVRTYGVVGAVRALRNINIVQRTMLPELVPLDLLAAPPRLAVPVHCVFGEQDALLPATVVKDLPEAIIAPACTVRLVPNAGHMPLRSAGHRAIDRGERMKVRDPNRFGPDQDRAGRRTRSRS